MRKRAVWQWVGLMMGILVTAPGAVTAQVRPDSARADSVGVRLAPLVVEVTRTSSELSTVPFAVSGLYAADLRAGRATLGLDEALVEVPGVQVSNRYNASLDQRISVRGFGARSAFGVRGVKILLDGIPQTLPDGQGQLTNIELSSVGSIQVLRGSASSLYGNASGGVIDIRTAIPNPNLTTARGTVLGGSFGSFKGAAGVTTPIRNGTVAVDAALTRADGFRTYSSSEMRQFALRVRQHPNAETSLIVAAQFADSPFLENPGSLNDSILNFDRTEAQPGNEAAGAGKSVNQGQLGLTLQRQLSTRSRMELTAYGLFRNLDNPLSFRWVGLDRKAFGFRSTVNVETASGPRLTFGVDLQRQRDDRINETTDRTAVTLEQLETVTEIGPFARVSIDLGGGVTATVGGRYDNLSYSADDRFLSNGDDSGTRTMAAFSGSAGVVFGARGDFSPFFNVGTSFESPTTTELANRPTGPGGFNPNLNPTRATTVEAGARGRTDRFAYGVTGFFSRVIDGLIPFEVPTDPSRRFFRNAGSANHRGIEIEGGWNPTTAVSAKTAYTYSHHTFDDFSTATATFDGNRIPGIPTHQFYGSVRVAPNEVVFFAVDHTIRSSIYANDANTGLVEGYGVTGIRAGADWVTPGARVSPFVGVLNVTDRQYVGSVVVNAFGGRFYEPAPGRNLYVGVTVTRN